MSPGRDPDATVAALADLAREHLAAGRPLVTRATGHSMWPVIRDGATVTIVPLAHPPAVGDVVLADLGRLVLHRVVARATSGYVLKGDAVARPDPPVAPGDILGRWTGPSSRVLALATRVSGPAVALASRASGPLGARLIGHARWLWSELFPR